MFYAHHILKIIIIITDSIIISTIIIITFTKHKRKSTCVLWLTHYIHQNQCHFYHHDRHEGRDHHYHHVKMEKIITITIINCILIILIIILIIILTTATSCLFVRRSFIVWCRSKGIYYKWNCTYENECENLKLLISKWMWKYEMVAESKYEHEQNVKNYIEIWSVFQLKNCIKIWNYFQLTNIFGAAKNWSSFRPSICVLQATLVSVIIFLLSLPLPLP